jgi:F-type H+-transporting ATPase subunit b
LASAAEDSHGSINWLDFGAWWNDEASPPFAATILNFAVLCWLVYKILKPGLSRRFADRREAVQGVLESAASTKAAAEKAIAEAKQKMDELQTEMTRLKEQVLEGGRAEAARIVHDAQERAAQMQREAEILLAQEMVSLKGRLREEMAHKVALATESLLRQSLTAADQENLAEEYLEAIAPAPRISRLPESVPRT